MLSNVEPALAEPEVGTNTKVSSLTDSMNDVTKVEIVEEDKTTKSELSETNKAKYKNKVPLVSKITLEYIVKIDLNDNMEEIPFI
jgi:adenine C2-methylase RlmN of 23S rRNA A2503 and tRNA A37